jgi:DNA polymerase-4
MKDFFFDMTRKIIHIDMDAFYAAIEQRDFPELQGKPVVVGGAPEFRGVVATASYEARKYGIRSAMPSAIAYQLCPHAIFVRPRFEVYKNVSSQLHHIFHQYTDSIEPLALDEAYMDVTTNKKGEKSATYLAKRILAQIQSETHLTASAGVSFNKFLAKLASGWKKPNGITIITPEQAQQFVDKLPIGKFYGVGKATEDKMLRLGINHGKDLQDFGVDRLIDCFGNKMGRFFYNLSFCNDERLVNTLRERKSIGKESTFQRDLEGEEIIKTEILKIAEIVCAEMQSKNLYGRTVQLKLRYANFKTITRSHSLEKSTNSPEVIQEVLLLLLTHTLIDNLPIRLLGVSISSFGEKNTKFKAYTLDLFEHYNLQL